MGKLKHRADKRLPEHMRGARHNSEYLGTIYPPIVAQHPMVGSVAAGAPMAGSMVGHGLHMMPGSGSMMGMNPQQMMAADIDARVRRTNSSRSLKSEPEDDPLGDLFSSDSPPAGEDSVDDDGDSLSTDDKKLQTKKRRHSSGSKAAAASSKKEKKVSKDQKTKKKDKKNKKKKQDSDESYSEDAASDVLDQRPVPRCYLAAWKKGKTNVFPRRDMLRYLGAIDEGRFQPGLRQQLSDVAVGQCIFLLAGLPPFLRVRDLRAKNRGDLREKLKEAKQRFEQRNGCCRMARVNEDFSNLDEVAKSFGWDDVWKGNHPQQSSKEDPPSEDHRQQFFLQFCKQGDQWLFSKEGGPPRLVIPSTVPGQRIYREGRFLLQGPGPDLATHDCSAVFNQESAYEAWKQTLVEACKKNPGASWLGAVNKCMVPTKFEKKPLPAPATLEGYGYAGKAGGSKEGDAEAEDEVRTRKLREAEETLAALKAKQQLEKEAAERAVLELQKPENAQAQIQEAEEKQKVQKAQEAEKEKQRAVEVQKAQEAEKEKQRAVEAQKAQAAEEEKQSALEVEKKAQEAEEEKQRALEEQKKAAEEAEADRQKQRALEVQKKAEEADLEKQRALEVQNLQKKAQEAEEEKKRALEEADRSQQREAEVAQREAAMKKQMEEQEKLLRALQAQVNAQTKAPEDAAPPGAAPAPPLEPGNAPEDAALPDAPGPAPALEPRNAAEANAERSAASRGPRIGGPKVYSSPSGLLDRLSPPFCKFTLNQNDSRWVATWKKQSERWLAEMANKSLTRTFNKVNWIPKLQEIHRMSWEKWAISGPGELPLSPGQQAQVPGSISQEILDSLEPIVAQMPDPKTRY